ncbi:hypothetical protein BJ741DRAFT_622908 [Chytriomyces cf. hyalinus JEL632]|nr:hypothetical protein BJ741DRAFT_622908 [Chytriomyces cf. hyalinus JEL632]
MDTTSVNSPNRRRNSEPSLNPELIRANFESLSMSASFSQVGLPGYFTYAADRHAMSMNPMHMMATACPSDLFGNRTYTSSVFPSTDVLATPMHSEPSSKHGKASKRKNPVASPDSEPRMRATNSSIQEFVPVTSTSFGLPPMIPHQKLTSSSSTRSSRRSSASLGRFNAVPGSDVARPLPVGAVVARSCGPSMSEKSETSMTRYKDAVGNVVKRRGSLSSLDVPGLLALRSGSISQHGDAGHNATQTIGNRSESLPVSRSFGLSAVLRAAQQSLNEAMASGKSASESGASPASTSTPSVLKEDQYMSAASPNANHPDSLSYYQQVSPSAMDQTGTSDEMSFLGLLAQGNLTPSSTALQNGYMNQASVFLGASAPSSFPSPFISSPLFHAQPQQHPFGIFYTPNYGQPSADLMIPNMLSYDTGFIQQAGQTTVTSADGVPGNNLATFPTPPRDSNAASLTDSCETVSGDQVDRLGFWNLSALQNSSGDASQPESDCLGALLEENNDSFTPFKLDW